jgi:site-specific DNA-cytosine methylase
MHKWETILAVDFNKHAASAYKLNMPSIDMRCAKVSDFFGKFPKADVVIGGPPCTSFTTSGSRTGESDVRNRIPDFLTALREVKPRMFLMENVSGLLHHVPYCWEIWKAFEDAGYVIRYKKINAVYFGTPQVRRRVWFWGIRKDLYASGLRHAWPEKTHDYPVKNGFFKNQLLDVVTLGQALGLSPGKYSLCEPDGTQLEKRFLPSFDYDFLKPHPWPYSDDWLEAHPPMFTNEPSETVQGCWGHTLGCVVVKRKPLIVRSLGVLEIARLQGLPESYRWPEILTTSSAVQIVGNGWACRMGDVFAKAFAKVDPESRTIISLFCGGGLGDMGWHGSYWSYEDGNVGIEKSRFRRRLKAKND